MQQQRTVRSLQSVKDTKILIWLLLIVQFCWKALYKQIKVVYSTQSSIIWDIHICCNLIQSFSSILINKINIMRTSSENYQVDNSSQLVKGTIFSVHMQKCSVIHCHLSFILNGKGAWLTQFIYYQSISPLWQLQDKAVCSSWDYAFLNINYFMRSFMHKITAKAKWWIYLCYRCQKKTNAVGMQVFETLKSDMWLWTYGI